MSKIKLGFIFLVLISLLNLNTSLSVSADSGTDDYPYSGGSTSKLDPWGFVMRNCTSFIAWRLNNDNGLAFNNTMKGPNGKTTTFSHAKFWGSRAAEIGFTVDNKPTPGSVAWWDETKEPDYGHVAWVISINESKVNVEDYNYGLTNNYGKREIAKDSPSGYIHFKDIDIGLYSGGGNASSRGPKRLDAFIRGTNTTGNNTYRNLLDNSPTWGGWVPLENSGDSNITSQPASVSRYADRIDVFARDVSGTLVHKWYDADSGWGSWVSRGACIAGNPTVTSWGVDRMDVFAKGCNPTGPNLVHVWYDGKGWWNETVQDYSTYRIASDPTATAWSSGRIDLFARGENGNLLHKWYEPNYHWGDWVEHGGCVTGNPAVASWTAGRLDIFVMGCGLIGNNVWHNWYDGNGWYWELTPSGDDLAVSNLLGAISYEPYRIDILARGLNGHPLHKSYEWNWSSWSDLGGGVAN